MSDPREHVVILGGGVGGCIAAYWLSATPELREKYRVTLYQTGWRLGGKGASSRGGGDTHRSEEHGPHVWFGFYENAFKTLRQCMEQTLRTTHFPASQDGLRLTVPLRFEVVREGTGTSVRP